MNRAMLMTLMLSILLLPAKAQETDQSGGNKTSLKASGHEFVFKAAPEQCTDVLYKEVATGVVKDAGGATPKSVRLAPKLYEFTCKCQSGDQVSKPTMVGQATEYTFHCAAAVVEAPPTPQAGKCDINRDDARNVNDSKRIGDQDLFHIRCVTAGNVLSAKYDTCTWAGGETCTHINARNELSGACADNAKVACIYYQTNDGNFKVIHGSYTYIPDKPAK